MSQIDIPVALTVGAGAGDHLTVYIGTGAGGCS